MTREDALLIVRKEYPNNLILSSAKYNNSYIFSVSNYNKLIPGDSTNFSVSVDDTGICKRFDYYKVLWSDEGLDMVNAMENTIQYIDVTKEELFNNSRQ